MQDLLELVKLLDTPTVVAVGVVLMSIHLMSDAAGSVLGKALTKGRPNTAFANVQCLCQFSSYWLLSENLLRLCSN